MKPNVLDVMPLERDGPAERPFSLYFPSEYKFRKGVEDPKLAEAMSQSGNLMERAHVPPECNIRYTHKLIDFMKFFGDSTKKAGFDKPIGLDIHPGHKVDLPYLMEASERLHFYLETTDSPFYVSLENIFKTSFSKVSDIVSFGDFLSRKNLDRVKITLDIQDLKKTDGINTLPEIAGRMSYMGSIDSLNCIHGRESDLKPAYFMFGNRRLNNPFYIVKEGN